MAKLLRHRGPKVGSAPGEIYSATQSRTNKKRGKRQLIKPGGKRPATPTEN